MSTEKLNLITASILKKLMAKRLKRIELLYIFDRNVTFGQSIVSKKRLELPRKKSRVKVKSEKNRQRSVYLTQLSHFCRAFNPGFVFYSCCRKC